MHFVKGLPIFTTLAALASAEKASFTHYGGGDSRGSPNCATAINACGNPGQYGVQYTAALSQRQFGAGPGEGAGPACGTCYRITIDTDLRGNPVQERSITVVVNNLCPIQVCISCAFAFALKMRWLEGSGAD